MSSPVFLHLREVECWRCGSARLEDGTRCLCGVYQNKNIQLRDGKWRDVRFAERPATDEAEALKAGVDHTDMLEAFLDACASRKIQ